MTKKWSSTKSMDGQTKRQASKTVRRESNHEIEKSIAQRAIETQLDRAMGLPTEDEFDWLDD